MSRNLSLFGIVAVSGCLWVAAGCGDDQGSDPAATGGPGSGGSGAQGGAATTGGSGGEAGGGNTGVGAQGCQVATPEPARYELELVSPREAGTAPSSEAGTPPMPSGHRIFHAYPGLEYNVRAVVIGGSFPYTFELADAPDGMTIDTCTGEIRWDAPAGTATPTLTVTDAEGASQTSSWTITVSADPFRFVDGVNGDDSGAGTMEAPWRSIARLKESAAVGAIVYFRAGTYGMTDIPNDDPGSTWSNVEFNGQYDPVQWIAFPGDAAPRIENAYSAGTENSRFLRFSGSADVPVYLDGFEITDAWDKGMQFASASDYPTFRRLTIFGVNEAVDGSNPAGIMTLASYTDPSYYGAYQDNVFRDLVPGGIKQYSHKKVLWENNSFLDSGGGPDLKSHVPRFEVRNCLFRNNAPYFCGLMGNMNHGADGNGETATGEIRYNLFLCGSPNMGATNLNQDGMAGQIDVYRNTMVGMVRVQNADSEDGPFHFERNVIINEDSDFTDHVTLEEVSDPSVVTFAENLVGLPAEGIVDTEGILQGEYVQYEGVRGHEIPTE